jgi:hypothetical protein
VVSRDAQCYGIQFNATYRTISKMHSAMAYSSMPHTAPIPRCTVLWHTVQCHLPHHKQDSQCYGIQFDATYCTNTEMHSAMAYSSMPLTAPLTRCTVLWHAVQCHLLHHYQDAQCYGIQFNATYCTINKNSLGNLTNFCYTFLNIPSKKEGISIIQEN